MKHLYKLFALTVSCTLLGVVSNLIAQQVPLDQVPLSNETFKLAQHPVQPDPD